MLSLTFILVAIGTILYVLYLILRPKEKTASSHVADSSMLLTEIKSNANKYAIAFDNCEFKDSSYVSEVEQDNSDYRQAAALVGSSIGAYYTPLERVETVQSVLFYKDEKLFGGKRFFQTFPIEKTTLKFHAMKGNISLYIDKDSANKYFFDLVPE
jgi:hypothetical protein